MISLIHLQWYGSHNSLPGMTSFRDPPLLQLLHQNSTATTSSTTGTSYIVFAGTPSQLIVIQPNSASTLWVQLARKNIFSS